MEREIAEAIITGVLGAGTVASFSLYIIAQDRHQRARRPNTDAIIYDTGSGISYRTLPRP